MRELLQPLPQPLFHFFRQAILLGPGPNAGRERGESLWLEKSCSNFDSMPAVLDNGGGLSGLDLR